MLLPHRRRIRLVIYPISFGSECSRLKLTRISSTLTRCLTESGSQPILLRVSEISFKFFRFPRVSGSDRNPLLSRFTFVSDTIFPNSSGRVTSLFCTAEKARSLTSLPSSLGSSSNSVLSSRKARRPVKYSNTGGTVSKGLCDKWSSRKSCRTVISSGSTYICVCGCVCVCV